MNFVTDFIGSRSAARWLLPALLVLAFLAGCQPQAVDYTKNAPAGATASQFSTPSGAGGPAVPGGGGR